MNKLEHKRQLRRERDRRWRLKNGYGVYIAVYPSGIYFGSGQLAEREKRHIRGLDPLGKKLKESATHFKVILKCKDKEECIEYENILLDLYGNYATLNKKMIAE